MIGLLAGAGQRTGRVLRAYFDFTKNGIIFPASADLNHARRDPVQHALAVFRSVVFDT